MAKRDKKKKAPNSYLEREQRFEQIWESEMELVELSTALDSHHGQYPDMKQHITGEYVSEFLSGRMFDESSTDSYLSEDDDFGNRKDYNPIGGHGLGGFYREPMDGGVKWGYSDQGKPEQQPADEVPNSVLSMRQPGWVERMKNCDGVFEKENQGILTIRQQEELSRMLRWESEAERVSALSRYEQGKDIAGAWQKFMDDLRYGKLRYQQLKRRSQKRPHKKS